MITYERSTAIEYANFDTCPRTSVLIRNKEAPAPSVSTGGMSWVSSPQTQANKITKSPERIIHGRWYQSAIHIRQGAGSSLVLVMCIHNVFSSLCVASVFQTRKADQNTEDDQWGDYRKKNGRSEVVLVSK